eukprot:4882998-Pyramimonas_sp.AAC.1
MASDEPTSSITTGCPRCTCPHAAARFPLALHGDVSDAAAVVVPAVDGGVHPISRQQRGVCADHTVQTTSKAGFRSEACSWGGVVSYASGGRRSHSWSGSRPDSVRGKASYQPCSTEGSRGGRGFGDARCTSPRPSASIHRWRAWIREEPGVPPPHDVGSPARLP